MRARTARSSRSSSAATARAGAIEVNAAPIRDPDGQVVAAGRRLPGRDRSASGVERAEREFVTNAAHELQTPLAAITSAVEVLQARREGVPADRDRFLAHIERECDAARAARPRAARARPRADAGTSRRRRAVALRPLLDDVARGASARRRGRGRGPLPGPAQPRSSNRDLLEQAVANLAANAREAHGARAIVSLAARAASTRRVAIEVVRHRAGDLADAERERVFERFYRGGGRDRRASGSGSRSPSRPSRRSAARSSSSSAPGGGTTARLVLPDGRRER